MDTRTLKILILGGYGTFGGRLAQLLADEARLTVVIAGRSRAKAEAFCAGLSSGGEAHAGGVRSRRRCRTPARGDRARYRR
jgi:NAD(P)-dependent dehydrogenase (short-subunit alcohol dehydrogenase family)